MSNPEVKARSVSRDGSAFRRLEGAVDGAVAQLKELRARLGQTQDENRELLDRLKIGKEGVERLLARIRFLEEQG